LDENLRFAEKEFRVRISARNQRLKISGDKSGVEKAHRFFTARLDDIRRGGSPHGRHAQRPPEPQRQSANSGDEESGGNIHSGLHFFHRGKIIRPRGKNQDKYLEGMRDKDIVIGIGPAGTGKTYLAMAAAIDHLKKKMVSRIILTRPAVEAGESLGFLPGDLSAKVDPYLRPLYDALYDMMDFEEAARYVERGIIEVAPLAYMRGRTLSDSFVILDEAQNCTHTQMKMFLTRLGQGSKAVLCGDITQIDLPGGKRSGLVEAQTVLANIAGIKIIFFTEADVVRHPLVQEIVKAYEKYEHKNPHKNP